MILSACIEGKNQEGMDANEMDKKPSHEVKEHHKQHSANDYMHQRSVEELIKNFESPERDAYQKPEEVLSYLGDISGQKIMDIGAGSGYFSVKLASRGAQVIAADVDDEFQEALKKRVEQNKIKNIELRKIPFDNPGLSNNEVDKVLIVNTYHHIEDRIAYFSLVRNGIKEDGELIIIDFFKKEIPVGPKRDHKISKELVVKELEAAGFEIVEVNTELLPYQYIIKAK
ncbi:MAG TPA: SAM-dependent methyltransferase [Cytophagales bacterium]|nr:SAM-dependent methyltransferase [Cytophagales bacterium]